MNVRQRKQLIGVAAGVVGVAAVAVAALGALLPVRVAVPEAAGGLPAGPNAVPEAAETATTTGPTLAQLQAVTEMDLRRPLFDPPAPTAATDRTAPAVPAPPAAPRMAARLVGTVHERGHSMAMFQTADGSIVFCRPGQSLDDPAGRVTVTRVEPNRVEIEFNGQPRELVLEESP